MAAAAIFLLVIAAFFYFLPAIVAGSRGHHNSGAITILNLFLGWTFLGWVAALVWACTAVNSGLKSNGGAAKMDELISASPLPTMPPPLPQGLPRKDSVSAPAVGAILVIVAIIGTVGFINHRARQSQVPGAVWSTLPSFPTSDTSLSSPRLETASISVPEIAEGPTAPVTIGRPKVQFAHRFACRDQSKLRILLNLYDPDKPKRWVRPLTAAIDDGSCTYVKDARGFTVLERAEPGIARVVGMGGDDGVWWTAAEVVRD